MRKRLKNWLDRLRAEIRGEVNIGKPGERGRTYAKAVLKPSISAKVYRVSEGKWYDLGKIC